MPTKIAIDTDNLIERYKAGESVLKMSNELGVSRGVITNRLAELGLSIRTGSEAMKLRMQKLTSEERLQLASAAHNAVRGKQMPDSLKLARAITIEKQGKISKYEAQFGAYLSALGIEFVYQKSVGIYNVDIAIPESSIAVEIFGGYWHRVGRHAARYRKRTEYLLSSGYLPIIVWVTAKFPLTVSAAEYVHANHKIRCSNKSNVSQEHVIGGNHDITTVNCFDPSNGSIISTTNG